MSPQLRYPSARTMWAYVRGAGDGLGWSSARTCCWKIAARLNLSEIIAAMNHGNEDRQSMPSLGPEDILMKGELL